MVNSFNYFNYVNEVNFLTFFTFTYDRLLFIDCNFAIVSYHGNYFDYFQLFQLLYRIISFKLF